MQFLSLIGSALLLISGCASYGTVENAPQRAQTAGERYSITAHAQRNHQRDNGIVLTLAFSGGGMRAAAFSFGVLEGLRDTAVEINGRSGRLLDEVDTISSVSGGSFTAAYYGLHGDRIFEEFDEVFLKRDVEGPLIRGLFNPLRWFSTKGRTEMAVEYFEEHVFHGATFADMKLEDRPLIVINASDLGFGVRFSFIQEYFDLLCSDLSSFPIARAVTASSSVPVLFNPVVIQNHPGCMITKPDWLVAAQAKAAHDSEMVMVFEGMESYLEKDRRQYIHLVDGGITDNLGLRAVYEIVEIAGGVESFLAQTKREPPRRLVFIAVDASTHPDAAMDQTNEQPSLEEIINAMSDAQLHRYNAATIELMKRSLVRWAEELSTPESPVVSYFIQLSFRDFQEPSERQFFSRIPSSYSLSDEQVDRLIEAGREQLWANPEFQRFLLDLRSDAGTG